MKVVTICQRNGGNGKSTSVLNLAAAFAEQGKRILLIDLDDQKNTSSAIATKQKAAYTVENLLFDQYTTLEDAAEETEWENIALIGGSQNLPDAAVKLEMMTEGHKRLLMKLHFSKYYDLCIIDTSPGLTMLTINAMCASHGIFIPLSSNYLSLEGLARTMEAYRKVRDGFRHDLKLYGAAFVNYDGKSRLARETQEKVAEQYPEMVMETVVGRNIKIEEAQARKQPVLSYAPDDKGAIQYRALAAELALRIGL